MSPTPEPALAPAAGDRPPLELWLGIECTFNRVGDTYLNRLERGGHLERPGDLDLLAGLGARRIRYPALWEQVAPGSPDTPDWRWTDGQLARLRGAEAGAGRHAAAPRQRPALHQPAGPRISREAGRVRRAGGAALPLGHGLYPGRRAADDRALQRPVRRVVPAPRHRRELRAHGPPPVPGHRAGDARCPRGAARRAARPDRRPGPGPRHGGHAARGRLPERAVLARLRPAVRAGRAGPPALDLPARLRGGGGGTAVVRRSSLRARHHRRGLLRHERALSGRAGGGLMQGPDSRVARRGP